MSVTKFETLPNEIFIDFFKNYVNSVDVFVVFAHDLNARFTALVRQCRTFHLDLTNIRKKDFDQCMRSTTIFRKKIQSLSISERLPGQINAFLQVFPTFDQFQRLDELNLSFNEPPTNQHGLLSALNSLSMTRIHTLSIKFDQSDHDHLLIDIYKNIFSLPTLRRLVLDIDYIKDIDHAFDLSECQIEYLTIRGYGLIWNGFSKILVSVNRLSYLNIEITYPHWRYISIDDINWDFEPLTKLRTLLFNWRHQEAPLDVNIFSRFLTKMPNLSRLTINGPNQEYTDDTIWEIVPTLLSSLTHLTWRICERSQSEYFLHKPLFKSLEKLSWIDQKMFNIYKVIPHHFTNTKENLYYYPILNPSDSTSSFWSLPSRGFDDNPFSLSVITGIHMTDSFPISMIQYKLNHVKFLRIDSINFCLYRWINKCIHLNNILQFDASSVKTNSHLFILLISSMNKLQTLSIDFNLLSNYQPIQSIRSMRELNISSNEHSFSQQNIHFLANLFPSIEHLSINTKDLHHVPLLETFLPNLITLTFQIIDPDYRYSTKKSKWIQRFRNEVTFEYQYTEDCITVWIDQDVFNDSFWSSTLNYHYGFSLSRLFRHLANKLDDP